MKHIRLHLWMLIFVLWLVLYSLFIGQPLAAALGITSAIDRSTLNTIMLFLPLLIAYPLIHKNPGIKVYPLKISSAHNIIWSIVIGAATVVVAAFVYMLPWVSTAMVEGFMVYPLWILILSAGLLTGVLDGLFFRGVLVGDYKHNGVSVLHIAVIVSIFSTFIYSNPIIVLIVMMIMRIAWTFMTLWTKSVFPAILGHVMANIGVVIILSIFINSNNQGTIRLLFGILTVIAVVVTGFGLKSMKARYEKLYSSEVSLVETKPLKQVYNWLFWVIIAFLMIVIQIL